jgi:hypothetical protein
VCACGLFDGFISRKGKMIAIVKGSSWTIQIKLEYDKCSHT